MQALIVCGGSPPSKNLLENEIKRANLTIGADSGGYVYIGFKHLPDVVIGDLDSFKYTNHEGVHVLLNGDQDTNDLEKQNGSKRGRTKFWCFRKDSIIPLKIFQYFNTFKI